MKKAHYFALVGLPLVSLLDASAARAQSAPYDANCKPITDQLRKEELEIQKMNPLISVMIQANDSACGVHNKLSRLFSRQPDPDKVTANDIIETSKPPASTSIPEGYSAEQWRAKQERWDWQTRHPNWRAEEAADQRRRSNAANDSPVMRLPGYTILPPAKEGGSLVIFQATTPTAETGTQNKLSAIEGEGTLLSDTGMKRGTFKDGNLEGSGEEVLPDGTWRGGEFKNDKLEGPGFEVSEENGQPVITEGNFDNDKPDGTVTRTYVNGVSERDVWADGERVAEGPMAAAGEAPASPIYDPNGRWHGATWESPGNIKATRAVHTINGKTYLDSRELDEPGPRHGMLERIYADGSTQFEDWENGTLMQVGVRGPRGSGLAIAPQVRPKPSPPQIRQPAPSQPPRPSYAATSRAQSDSDIVVYVHRVCSAEYAAAPAGDANGNWGTRDGPVDSNLRRALAGGGVAGLREAERNIESLNPNGYPGQEQDARVKIAYWLCALRAGISKLEGR